MNRCQGHPSHIQHSLVARVTTVSRRWDWHKETVLVTTEPPPNRSGHAAMLTAANLDAPRRPRIPTVSGIPADALSALHDGDIVLIEPSGQVQRLWDAQSPDQVIMVTNTCNCRCMMCPQPSTKDADDHLAMNLRLLRLANPQGVRSIGLTGGEPTLRLDHLQHLLTLCKTRFPAAQVALLSNGRAFREWSVVQRLAAINHPHLLYGIALQSDVATLHDQIMGAPGCFAETVQGLHHLALARQRVEIRVVIMRENYRRLPQMAEFLYRNFPFAVHIAFMGMETTGLAREHLEAVWVDPVDYQDELTVAVRHLHQRDVHVSIYNLPHCVLPEALWPFAADSISGWKKSFLACCQECVARDDCAGLFATSVTQSRGIQAIEGRGVGRD